MYIKYNHLSIAIISLSIITALANYAFAKTKQKCFTCVCKTHNGSNIITPPNCNFDSILTNKTIDDLPENIQTECVKNCKKQDQKYVSHQIWTE